MEKLWKWSSILVTLVISFFALHSLHREFTDLRFSEVLDEFHKLGWKTILFSFGGVLGSFLCLSFVDYLAFRRLDSKLPYFKIGLASFAGYGVSYNLGFSAITGTAVRYQLLKDEGIDGKVLALALARVFLFFWLAAGVALGTSLLLETGVASSLLGLSPSGVIGFGSTVLLFVLAAIVFFSLVRRDISVAGVLLHPPQKRELALAILFGLGDWVFAATALNLLLPTPPGTFLDFLSLFVLAQLGGLISNVPGGLGVFETILVHGVPADQRTPALISSLLIFRFVYYVVPLLLAGLILLSAEVRRHRTVLHSYGKASLRTISSISPTLLNCCVFTSGCILLLSGDLPSEESNFDFIPEMLALPVLEISHFFGSVIGVCLLILARGLFLRLQEAFYGSCILLTLGIVMLVVRHAGAEQFILPCLSLWGLWIGRQEYDRKGKVLQNAYPPWSFFLTFLALGASIWVLMMVHRDIPYSHDLWWEFAFESNASRGLRAAAGASVVFLAASLYSLLSTPRFLTQLPGPEDLKRALEVVKHSPVSNSWLALLGDKTLLFSPSGNSFLMFAAERSSLVALGDPIGKEEEFRELLWRFREIADEQNRFPVFYEISQEYLASYVDLGLTLMKLGEEARVDVSQYSLEGGERSGQRQNLRKLEREGAQFEVVLTEKIPEILPDIKAVSDSWLQLKSAKEKGFSLGRFDERYLLLTPCALVRYQGKIVAFANLWLNDTKEEFSVDLMRYDNSAPKGIMEYLFVKVILWGKEEGYRLFNLGMAPLSGLESHSLAPVWQRLGSALFHHGEHFYNFQGLRDYKEKFHPQWSARYLASPGGLALPRVLADVTTLISGGVKGVFSK